MHHKKEYRKFQKHLIQSSIVGDSINHFLSLLLYVNSLGLTNPLNKNMCKTLLETCFRNRNSFLNVINKVFGQKSILDFLDIFLHSFRLILMSTKLRDGFYNNTHINPWIYITFQGRRFLWSYLCHIYRLTFVKVNAK